MAFVSLVGPWLFVNFRIKIIVLPKLGFMVNSVYEIYLKHSFSLTQQWWALYPEADPVLMNLFILRIWLLSWVGIVYTCAWKKTTQSQMFFIFFYLWLMTSHHWPGMLPHKTKRGQAALERLKVFDGIPPPYDKVMVLNEYPRPQTPINFVACLMSWSWTWFHPACQWWPYQYPYHLVWMNTVKNKMPETCHLIIV